MLGDGLQRPVVDGSPGAAHRVQELTNPAFSSPDARPDAQEAADMLPPLSSPDAREAADMLPPLALEDFQSLDELDPAWLKWEESPVDVKTFYRKYDLPQVVKVDDGDYGNFGVGTHVDVAHPFLLYTSRRCSKVLVANIYWDDSQQQYLEVGPRIVIPVNYPGWFYFLQDSGAVGKTLKSIKEVIALQPRAFLVRFPIPCFRRTLGREKPAKNTNMRVYVRDKLAEGEVLNYDSIHAECVEQTRPACCLCWAFGKKTTTFVTEEQYLRCTDLDGREVLLGLTLHGEFSVIGEPGTSSVDCVYQLSDVVGRADLPVNMKLCCGQPPSTPCSFTGLLRMEDIYIEETVIACAIGTPRHFMVEFPTDSEIKFIMATDAYRYFDHPVIQRSMEQCDKQIDAYVNSIKVVQSFYPEHIKLKNAANKEADKNVRCLPPLPMSTHAGSNNESMDTTDDYTDDSEFSYCTEDDENLNQNEQVDNTERHNNSKTIRSALTVKISDDPVIIYDDNYEEIPGNQGKASTRPPPPPIPIPVQTPVAVPPPPPMFDETLEDTYDMADHIASLPPLVHASYSRAKLERTLSQPETVPVNDNEDIIAPPGMWSDAQTEVPLGWHQPTEVTRTGHQSTEVTWTGHQSTEVTRIGHQLAGPMQTGHQPTEVTPTGHPSTKVMQIGHQSTEVIRTGHQSKPKSSVSESVRMFNERATVNTSNSNGSTPSTPLGCQLRERLDAFLTDSVHELHRLQANGAAPNGSATAVSSAVGADQNYRHCAAPRVPPKPRLGGSIKSSEALQSHEDVNAYLDNIFNPDSMTDEVAPIKPSGQNKLHSGTLPNPRTRLMRPVSGNTTVYRSMDDSAPSKPQHRPAAGQVDGGLATIRRHNVKSLSVVQPTPANRPNHLPVPHNGTNLAHLSPRINNNSSNITVAAAVAAANNSRENIFIPIRRPNSVSPPQDHSGGSSGGEYPLGPASSPERLGPHRADSGIFVSPRLSDFHLDLESPYSAPSEDPSWAPPSDLSPLSVTEIAHCLRYIGMKDAVVFRFVEEQIDGTLLQELDATLLKEGFPELNALERKKVLDFVGGWRPKKL